MKRPDNTEMDQLLRRFAGRAGEGLPATQDANGGATSGGAHLDADELSAYAEGALPEAARARYFAHLADCDTCRKLVTGLTLHATTEAEGKARVAAVEASPSKSWRERLAAIFSPPVLRYGVPALALLAVIVVALIAMRTPREENFVAQNKEEARSYSPEAAGNSNSAALPPTPLITDGNQINGNVSSNTASPSESAKPTQSEVSATPAPAKTVEESRGAPPPPPRPGEAEPLATQSRENKDGAVVFGNEAAGKRGQEQPAAAPRSDNAPVLAAAPPVNDAAGRDKEDKQQKTKAAEKDDDETVARGRSTVGGMILDKAESNEDQRREKKAPATASVAQSAPRRPAAAAKSGPADSGAARERAAETRNVGGHRFQRQGGAWVDSAYNSQPTTNVHRGSEQYRALGADEPGLRNIADQFNGEVIIVWKSRAYRFY